MGRLNLPLPPQLSSVPAIDRDALAWAALFKDQLEKYLNAPRCRVFNSAAQAVTTGTLTALLFDSERYDSDNIHDTATNTTRLTCRTPGVYAIFGHAEWAGNPTNSECDLRLNGATYIARENIVGDHRYMHIDTEYQLGSGDYVELVVFHQFGANLNVNSAPNSSPEFAMSWVGPSV